MLALEAVCASGPHTVDVGGTATTSEIGDAVVREMGQLRQLPVPETTSIRSVLA